MSIIGIPSAKLHFDILYIVKASSKIKWRHTQDLPLMQGKVPHCDSSGFSGFSERPGRKDISKYTSEVNQ